ncbi:alpha-glucan family phosphorylase [Candidatus Beckwithbacteria bacterium]|nr:alpha-glucan family phosphorylase [Candidatus Beckwithbacteria bacterium]
MYEISPEHPVAYFCTEYGLKSSLPIYAGGLGILAGDTIKEADDRKFPLIAVGLLYRGEGVKQKVDDDGRQIEEDFHYDPLSEGVEHVYIDEMPLFIKVHLTQIDVWCRCWKETLRNGNVLYLLDTETDQNLLQERNITHALYSGTEEAIIKQQLILGIGGVKLLHALNIHPSLYHINEGRPAFLHWQLIRHFMDQGGLTYEEAAKKAREKTVYTNHTLVGAGNPGYNINLLRMYGQYYADKMGISIDQLLEPGMENNAENFVVTRFALNVSCKASGVSKLHTELSKKSWPEYNWCNVTNGVHMPTWQDPEIRDCNKDKTDLWFVHKKKKQELMEFVRQQTGFGYDPERLVISWARRIAEYKQLNKLFEDIDRLTKIVKDPTRPIQILISGKAHVLDTRGKMILQEAINFMQGELNGYAIYIPNYNIDIGKMMTKGSDVWLNDPVYGMEASGTSGMKAISNGVLHFTVPDGWSYEVDWDGIGFVIDPKNTASSIYDILETQIIPLYYERDPENIPQRWLKMMKRSIELSKQFSTTRMFDEYVSLLYKK